MYIRPDSLFANIGERCNVAGSKRFARLISSGQFDVIAYLPNNNNIYSVIIK